MTDTILDLPRRINPGRACGHTVEHGRVVRADDDPPGIFEEAPGNCTQQCGTLKYGVVLCLSVHWFPHKRLMFTPDEQIEFPWGSTLHYRGGTQGFCWLTRQYPEQKLSIIVLLTLIIWIQSQSSVHLSYCSRTDR
jgi:hypothetical protein